MPNTNFPGSIDTNPGDPTAQETLGAGNHAFLHGFVQDAIIAIETYIGVTGSAVTSSLTYLINHVAAASGGTGQFVYAVGDLLYASATTALSRLAIGTTGQVLAVVGGLPAWTTLAGFPSGSVTAYVSTTPPSGWLLCNQQSFSTITYPSLAVALSGNYGYGSSISASYTASVISASAHGLVNGQVVFFSGSVPGTLSLNTAYYVINATTNTFQVSATSGGSAITLSGSGSLTVNANLLVPDMRARLPIGAGAGTKVATIVSISSNVISASGLTNNNNNEFQTGEAIVFNATTAGNLTNASTYYVIRVTNTTFSLATTLANAQNGVVITLAGTEAGSFTLSFTTRNLADTGGEEKHAMSSSELLSHTHQYSTTNGSGVNFTQSAGTNTATSTNIFSTGGNVAMNVMNPFLALQYIIKT